MSRSTLRRATRGAVIVTTGLAVAVVPFAAVAGSAQATTVHHAKTKPAACSTGALPTAVVGKPAGFKAGLPAGAWVWHDSKGFHLRVTHDSKTKEVFSGTITSSRKISAHRVRAEHNDILWKNNKHKTVKFTLRNYGKVDGVDFTVGCAKTVKITLSTKVAKAKAVKLATTQIHLGAANTNPATNGFTITRTK